ncbi:mechanosensitive ion channel family protein [Desulfatibacillum aliphaticivorans]|uniref:mechanosensitive ion channel family protein n=1 Tax=Desulfatibacillum aliphaticivorans TaxID=218208 RepID=UPI0004135072|nr:mechanosensitive ion channel family protein [Desulfatibacillum aliphaticivorans]
MDQWLDANFWQTIIQKTGLWFITSVPSILFILILAVIALKSFGFGMKRVKVFMAERMKSSGRIDSDEADRRLETLTRVLTTLVKIVLWTMVGMLILKKIGVDIAPLIAGAGIAGLAVGFGAQELVRDVISGFFILLENHIRTGDVASINGATGVVENIGLRTTSLRDPQGVIHMFQNGKINSMSNLTKGWSAAVFDIGVAYKEDTDSVSAIMEEIAGDLAADPEISPLLLEPFELLGVDAFGDSAVVIKARLKTKPLKQWVVKREYLRRLKKAFDQKGVEIPFPHQTLYWGSASPPVAVDQVVSTENLESKDYQKVK